jgi:Phage integrase, N-terminal SAM-like domain
VRDQIRLKHYSLRTEAAYVRWIKEYITFHKNATPHTFSDARKFY